MAEPAGTINAGTLCPLCESLDLDFERFVIPSNRGPSFHGEKRMGTLQEIQARTSCPLCGLLLRAFVKFSYPITDGSPVCTLMWTLDGMERVPGIPDTFSVVHRTRRLQIVWRNPWSENSYTEQSYIVLVAPEGRFDVRDSFEDENTVRRSRLFLGRLLTSLTDLFNDSFDLAEKWLKICAENHGSQCAAPPSLLKRSEYELLRSSYFGVLDVDDMCLTTLPSGGGLPKYVALSYTWGFETPDNKRFRCDDGNVHLLKQRQGIKLVTKGLPRAIQDAIILTRKLRLRYLWVDALCIIQDNESSWSNNAAIMDVIYGNAWLTICAADNDSAEVGLKALWSSGRGDNRQAEEYWIEYRKPDDDKPIQLLLSHPSESYIAHSRWNHRGWTLQERLLSPRCLIFVDGRMYLQCRSTTMSEDIYSDEPVAGWSVELHGAPAQIVGKLKREPVQAYKDLIKMYTSRDLTVESDILDAFKGITNVVEESFGETCETLFGLPNSHFDWALLWSPDERLERRTIESTEPRVAKRFPSWAWCGWKSESVGADGRSSGRVSYKDSTINGSETGFNLHGWLLNRTWITYYICTNQGRLRLIWDPTKRVPNEDMTEDWRGYQSPADWQPPSDTGSKNGNFPKYDLHGRRFDHLLPVWGRVSRSQRHFKRRLLDSRLQVIVLEAGHDHTADFKNSSSRSFDEPYLQFFTWSAKFFLFEPNNETEFKRDGMPGRGLKRFGIEDRNGSFAGTCVLDEKWSLEARRREPQEFIALSFAREFAVDEGSVDRFYKGPDSQSEWQLYNVMMLEYQNDDSFQIASRAGLGKVYKTAFANGLAPTGERQSREWFIESQGMYWKEIVLG